VSDEKSDKEYDGLFLENRYLKVLILPELGGKIHMALDKSRSYHFVYYNEVIKPALVGLTGPWVCGGIEFNWPQHHRPSTFLPVEWEIRKNGDDSWTVWLNEIELMSRMRGCVGFTMHPERAYIEISGRLYNPQPLPKTFLWWANPAVAVNEHYQTIFPPDVHTVMDHGKRDLTRFPISTSEYYKVDYSSGVDISWFKNIPVPTSYMAHHSNFDFVGGYDHGVEAGVLHVADHHISPGKKMWTWGTADFGRAWYESLSDDGRPYIELMTGVFTDNQPDFSWIQPGEERRFTQYFFPYSGVDRVCVANDRVVLGIRPEGRTATVELFATSRENLRVLVMSGETVLLDERSDISPARGLSWSVPLTDNVAIETVLIKVYDEDDSEIARFQESALPEGPTPKRAEPAPDPRDVKTTEELYLWGLHLEQYRHATYSAEPYYQEALRRDPGDVRANNALGLRALRAGSFDVAIECFTRAISRGTSRNPNPFDSEPFYNLGVALWYARRLDDAYAAFFKATWSQGTKAASLYALARIDLARGNFSKARSLAAEAVNVSGLHMDAWNLLAVIDRKIDPSEQEVTQLRSQLKRRFPLNYHIETEEFLATSRSASKDDKTNLWLELWERVYRRKENAFVEVVIWYGESGLHDDAIMLCVLCRETMKESINPLILYFEALNRRRAGDIDGARLVIAQAETLDRSHVFPNQLEAIDALESAMELEPSAARAAYHLGNLFYDKGLYEKAHSLWQLSAQLAPESPHTHRNLSLSFFNKRKDPERARAAIERAWGLDTADPRLLMELDVLYDRLGVEPDFRLSILEKHLSVAEQRDDLVLSRAALLNRMHRHAQALDVINGRRFHPWEGGEGRVPYEYRRALLGLARQSLDRKAPGDALAHLNLAREYPAHLGEGRLPNTADNEIDFLSAVALLMTGKTNDALQALHRATTGDEQPSLSMYYNDRPVEAVFYQACAWRALGNEKRARSLFFRLRDLGADHMNDTVRIDFFAVSLPDLQVFESDMQGKNRHFCLSILGLGLLGLGAYPDASQAFTQALQIRPSDQIADVHRALSIRLANGNVNEETRIINGEVTVQGKV